MPSDALFAGMIREWDASSGNAELATLRQTAICRGTPFAHRSPELDIRDRIALTSRSAVTCRSHPILTYLPAVKILLLDTDRSTIRMLDPGLAGASLTVAHAQGDGLRHLAAGGWDLIFLDLDFSGAGLELLQHLRERDPQTPVVLLAQRPSMELTLEAIRLGAHDVLVKPPLPGRVGEIFSSLVGSRRVRMLPAVEPARGETIIGCSPEIMAVFRSIARAAASDATVLVTGQSGTGKEMVARALHSGSPRARGPFVAINCAAIPENLLESELFGHEKGAFTGAIGRRVGRFERASGGTLFLDEIGDMSVALQSKILRALQEREIERVGGTASVSIDVRVIAATNRDLPTTVREGRFREDLFYRLAVVVLHLPPLAERGADLDLLVEHFVTLNAREHGRPIRGVAEEVFDILRDHPWPGNVRQLRNAIERAVVMAHGEFLLPQHLPPDVFHVSEAAADGADPLRGPLCTLAEMERRMIQRALRETGHNLTLAAERLGIHRNTLRRKIMEHGLREA
jgi:DNA-binding NtrC family response regulator